MGAYKFDPANPPVMEGGKRNPVGPDDDPGKCHCAALQLSPRLLRPVVRAILGPVKVAIVTEADLHPNVDRAVTSMLTLSDTATEARSVNGHVVRIAFTGAKRVGDDFHADVALRLNGKDAFVGSISIAGAWTRGKVTFAHSVIGAIELLYLHLPELAAGKRTEVDLRIGVIALAGRAVSIDDLNAMTAAEVAGAVALFKSNGGGGPGGGPTCQPTGPFDPLAVYGAFPSAGYNYFQSASTELREKRL